jgi:CHAT domain-containing protein/Tfp pilus assembly protein PilF
MRMQYGRNYNCPVRFPVFDVTILRLLALIIVIGYFGSSAIAQEDLWDSLMDDAIAAHQRADLSLARQIAERAVYQGQYENADRYVTSLALLGRIAQEQGELALAESNMRKAIEIIDQIPGPLQAEKAVIHNNLGSLLDLSGDLAGAEVQYRAALSLYRTVQDLKTEDRFLLLVNLAGLLERRTRSREAEVFYLEAVSLRTHVSRIAGIMFDNNYGAFLQRRGKTDQARQLLQNALDALPPPPLQPVLRGALQHNLGTLALEVGDLIFAKRSLREAELVRRATLGSQHEDTARTLSNLALLAEREERHDDAMAYAREASAVVSANLSVTAGTRAAAAPAQKRLEWREGFATHLRLLDRAGFPAERKAEEALTLVQTIKHGELAQVFAGASMSGDSGLSRRVKAIQQQIDLFQKQQVELATELESGNAARERRLRNDLAATRGLLERLQLDIARDFPRYHELVSGRVTPVGKLQQTLGPDEAALMYFVAEHESFAIAVTRDRMMLQRIPVGRTELSRRVQNIRRAVDPEHADDAIYPFEQAYTLYRDFVEPLSGLLQSKPLWFIVPDGALESLPFALLVASKPSVSTPVDWAAASWLVKAHATITLPSLGALVLARNATAQEKAPEALVAFADPAIGIGLENHGGSRKARNLKPGAIWSAEKVDVAGASRPLQSLSSNKRLANPDAIRRLTPLPDTADEARAVAASLGGGTLMMRENATESVLKRTDLSQYRHLLFATHGVMASDFVEFGEPALVMTPPATPSELDDGLLAASEIAQLRLNADWVLLSACNTAAPDGTPGAEGLSGLAKAFFHAGARNLLVSHWSVVSESTVLISTGTFERLRKDPSLDKARALQRSMLALIDRGSDFGHPMYWAPFVLVGDGR